MTHRAAPDAWDVNVKPMDAAMFQGDQPPDFGLRLLQVRFPAHELPELTRRLREHAAGPTVPPEPADWSAAVTRAAARPLVAKGAGGVCQRTRSAAVEIADWADLGAVGRAAAPVQDYSVVVDTGAARAQAATGTADPVLFGVVGPAPPA